MRRYAIFASLLFLTNSLLAGQLYWTTGFGMSIETANTDGTGRQTLLNAGTCSTGIAVDPAGDQLFWGGVQGRAIRRANLDGTAIQTLFRPVNDPNFLAFDPTAKKLYWTEDWPTPTIMRANSDGSGLETVLTLTQGYGGGIAVDNQNGYMYWANTAISGLYRSRLDGAGLTQIVPTGISPIAVSLDIRNSKIYWTENGQDTQCVRRANLDGSGIETLVRGLWNPIGLALDVDAGKVYWTDFAKQTIQRANLDGSMIENVITGLNNPSSLSLVAPEPATSLLIVFGCGLALRRRAAR